MVESTNPNHRTVDGKMAADWLVEEINKVGRENTHKATFRLIGSEVYEKSAPGQAPWTIDGFDKETRHFTAKRDGEDKQLGLKELSNAQVVLPESSQRLYREINRLPEPTVGQIEGGKVASWLSEQIRQEGADKAPAIARTLVGAHFHEASDKEGSRPFVIKEFDTKDRMFIAERSNGGGAEPEKITIGTKTLKAGSVAFPESKAAAMDSIVNAKAKGPLDKRDDIMSWNEWNGLRDNIRSNAADVNIADMTFSADLYMTGGEFAEGFRNRSVSMPPAVKITMGSGLANPNRNKTMDEDPHMAAHSAFDHITRTLAKRDEDSVALLAAAAREANKAIGTEQKEVRTIVGDNEQNSVDRRVDLKDRLMDRGMDMTTASDVSEEINSRKSTKEYNYDVKIVAPTREEAMVYRGLVDMALKIMPPDNALTNQSTILNPGKLPSAEDMEAQMKPFRPPVFRDDQNRRVAVFAAEGTEKAVADFVEQSVGPKTTIVPYPGKELQEELTSRGTGHRFDPVGGRSKPVKMAEETLKSADKIIIGYNPNDRDPFTDEVVAMAARMGKIGTIVNQNGEVLPKHQVENQAIKANPSWIDQKRDENAAAFDVPAGSPAGRLGMLLLTKAPDSKADAAPHLTQDDREKIAKIPANLSEVVLMAGDKDGANELHSKHKVSGPAIRLLADKASLQNARQSLQETMVYAAANGIAIVGRDDYPETLRKDKNSPDVLFVKGDTEKFKDLKGIVSIIGEEKMLPGMAQKTAEFSGKLLESGTPVAFTEGQGVPAMTLESLKTAKASPVLVLPTAHSMPGQTDPMKWKIHTADTEFVAASKDLERRYRVELTTDGNNTKASLFLDTGVERKSQTAKFAPGDNLDQSHKVDSLIGNANTIERAKLSVNMSDPNRREDYVKKGPAVLEWVQETNCDTQTTVYTAKQAPKTMDRWVPNRDEADKPDLGYKIHVNHKEGTATLVHTTGRDYSKTDNKIAEMPVPQDTDNLSRVNRAKVIGELGQIAAKTEAGIALGDEGKAAAISMKWQGRTAEGKENTLSEKMLYAEGHGGTYVIGASSTKDAVMLSFIDGKSKQETILKTHARTAENTQAFEAEKPRKVAEFKDIARETNIERSPSHQILKQREDIVEAGGFVVSQIPDKRLTYSKSARDFVNEFSAKTPESVDKALTMTVRASDTTVVSQAGMQSEVANAVCIAALKRVTQPKTFSIVAITPGDNEKVKDEVDGNRLLTSGTPAEIISGLGVKGNNQAGLRSFNGADKVAIKTGKHPEIAAQALSTALKNKLETGPERKSPENRKSASMEEIL